MTDDYIRPWLVTLGQDTSNGYECKFGSTAFGKKITENIFAYFQLSFTISSFFSLDHPLQMSDFCPRVSLYLICLELRNSSHKNRAVIGC